MGHAWLLAKRLLNCCPPDMRQCGFVSADGALENTAVLDAVLGDCRKKARGLPDGFINYLALIYNTVHTSLAVNGENTNLVRVGCGVRQEDPLSPIFFNMAMDLILASLPQGIGYGVEGEKIAALTYADDLVLLAGSKVEMQEPIDSVVEIGEILGLRVNSRKSSVLLMVPDGERKKHHYLAERVYSVRRSKLQQVACVALPRRKL
ncbi:unnamed protein product [Euphydryas editha]|uniref:Reverse transcriptase domain-containing protein n=1 Tax=Euphydryas editha TaxID=104508 RepID=A0AAU9TE86_EUPED|nr:unnamed protein product [Euphydryas editha]